MTTPTDDQRSPWPAPEVPQVGLRGRFTSEVMAGGAVVERADDELVGGFRGGAGVAVIVALFAMLGFFSIWWLVFAVGLLVSVFLHELGHFATARWTGMKATQFFIGFGPRVWSFRRGETEYGVRALPLGAFVRIVGMNMMDDVEPSEEGRAYRSKSYPRRLLVISAGSIMHMVIALVLLSGVYTLSGQSVLGDGAEVRAVSEGLPAEVGGVLPGDVILSVGGVEVIEGAPLGEAIVSHSPGDSVDVVVDRDGALLSLPVTLGSYELVGGPDDVAFLGVSSSPLVDVVKRSWWSSP
ncbi:MAG: site-2 protease family protein, partial [Ilumatobacteraceae bacterium]